MNRISIRSINKFAGSIPKPKPKPKPMNKPKPIRDEEAEYYRKFRETGKINWKHMPQLLKTRARGVLMIFGALPLVIVTGYELWRRLEGKSVKRVQRGELTDDRQVIPWDEEKIWQTERNSWYYKLFGRDYFLDGFTSDTMPKPKDVESSSSSPLKN
ncbi:uncharacterized protein KQ657_003951 [Scheffersomyces spartinae]|uniref:Uncharacterized protein n=1 Tax=Scheffersomyces spartinae TaxID=45513 RepID=A0A9P8AJG4_9ASCO|nr:uncharacterized protein KQ657_003951 [Scheffersomyces spartinae]KAG7194849.1 hypothetical protein KQ657_003951 [Scheffersomyces spartinae]